MAAIPPGTVPAHSAAPLDSPACGGACHHACWRRLQALAFLLPPAWALAAGSRAQLPALMCRAQERMASGLVCTCCMTRVCPRQRGLPAQQVGWLVPQDRAGQAAAANARAGCCASGCRAGARPAVMLWKLPACAGIAAYKLVLVPDGDGQALTATVNGPPAYDSSDGDYIYHVRGCRLLLCSYLPCCAARRIRRERAGASGEAGSASCRQLAAPQHAAGSAAAGGRLPQSPLVISSSPLPSFGAVSIPRGLAGVQVVHHQCICHQPGWGRGARFPIALPDLLLVRIALPPARRLPPATPPSPLPCWAAVFLRWWLALPC